MHLRALWAALGASAIPAVLATRPLKPSLEMAAERGPQIFNSVYDSLRKWGAVVHPNGMSLFLATVPEGVMLHHGNNRNETPTELDWLAYEIEHAEMFARAKRPGGPGGPGGKPPGFEDRLDDRHEDARNWKQDPNKQVPLSGDDAPAEENAAGWLHTYRTTRPLHFLYIDGMSGDKGSYGVLDTQDILLRGVRDEDDEPSWPPPKVHKRAGPAGEHQRALDLCSICASLGLQGVIRTESPGSEIIKCNFFDGLEQVQSLQRSGAGGRPGHGGPGHKPGDGPRGPGGPGGPGGPWGPGGPRRNEADRYREISSDRTLLDYSSMVSAFFFPVNVTNPNSEQAGWPRLIETTEDEMDAVREYLFNVVEQRYDATIARYTWRDVAELIVRRYAPQITAMEEEVETVDAMADKIRFLVEVFIDYSVADEKVRDAEAEERCAAFYIQTMPLETDADRLLYTAFKATNARVCATLFEIRDLVIDNPAANETALTNAKDLLKSLKGELGWIAFE